MLPWPASGLCLEPSQKTKQFEDVSRPRQSCCLWKQAVPVYLQCTLTLTLQKLATRLHPAMWLPPSSLIHVQQHESWPKFDPWHCTDPRLQLTMATLSRKTVPRHHFWRMGRRAGEHCCLQARGSHHLAAPESGAQSLEQWAEGSAPWAGLSTTSADGASHYWSA